MANPQAQRPPRNGSRKQNFTSTDKDTQISLIPVIRFLENALLLKKKGDSSTYSHLVEQLRNRDDVETLWRFYLGLSTCVPLICENPEIFKDLTHALFMYDFKMEERISQAFVRLIVQLISANTLYVPSTLNLIVKCFKDTHDEGESFPVLSCSYMLLHRTLFAVVHIVPGCNSRIFNMLSSRFPHRLSNITELTTYTAQLLVMVEYLPLLEKKILNMMISNFLEIDVEILFNDSGDALTIEKKEDEEVMFLMEDSTEAVPLPILGSTAPNKDVDVMANKLDSMMCIFFKYLDRMVKGQSSFDVTPANFNNENTRYSTSEKVYRVFNYLMSSFESSILLTHRSKFVQYILFYLCGIWDKHLLEDLRNSDTEGQLLSPIFAKRLVEITLEAKHPLYIRQNAAGYFGSFLGRANFITADLVISLLYPVLLWAKGYVKMDISEELKGKIVNEKHKLFYTVCQAVFYAICFRGHDIGDWIQQQLEDIQSILCNVLDPLSKCIPSICCEFARVVCRECYSNIPTELHVLLIRTIHNFELKSAQKKLPKIIVCQKHNVQPDSSENPSEKDSHNEIFADTFFPYDPYLLRKSHIYISGMYNHWTGQYKTDAENSDVPSVCSDRDLSDEIDYDLEDCTDRQAIDDLEECSAKLASSFISDRMSIVGTPPLFQEKHLQDLNSEDCLFEIERTVEDDETLSTTARMQNNAMQYS